MKVQKQLQAKPSHVLLPDRTIREEDDHKKVLLKKVAHIIINDGTAEEYVSLYHEIPVFMKNLRNIFFKRIFQKARSEDWPVRKMADIASQIY